MEAAGLPINTGVEKELICATRVSIAGAKGNSPQSRNGNYVIILIPQLSLKLTGNSVKREDLTAHELANQNAMAEAAEIGRRLSYTPRSIKQGTGFEALQQLTIRRKDIHGTTACTSDHKILCLILRGKSDVEVAPDVLYIERNEVPWQTVIVKCLGWEPYLVEVFVENSDFAFVHVSYKKKVLVFDLSNRRAGQS